MNFLPYLVFIISMQFTICYSQKMVGKEHFSNYVSGDKAVSTTMLKISSSNYGGREHDLKIDG